MRQPISERLPARLRFRAGADGSEFALAESAALADRSREQALGERRRHQHGDRYGTGGLTEDSDVAGVAAELGNVRANPFQCRDLVLQTEIAGWRTFPVKCGMRQEAEHPEPIVETDQDDALCGETSTVGGRGTGRGEARLEAAAMDPHHHRTLFACRPRGGPHVGREAVLAPLTARQHGASRRRWKPAA